MGNLRIYTADDEEPRCEMCDHKNEPDDQCLQYCGASHGWYRYERTEREEVEE